MQVTDKDGNVFGIGGLEITTSDGKPKIPVINTDITIGVTSIVGGVSGRLLFDDAGVVGETASINWNPSTSTLSLFDSPFISQAGNLSANTGFSIIGTASSNYTISSSRQFIFNTGQSMYFNTDTDGGSALDRAWYFAGARTGMTGGRTYGALTVDSSGFPSFTLYNNDNGPRILLASNATSYFNGGNLLVGTTTDAGYKLDVTGTVAVRANLTVFSESEFRQNGITNYITSSLGIFRFRGWSSGITTAYLNGWNQESFLNSPLNVGSTSTTMVSMLSVYGSRTATSAIARGVYFNNTLVAAANNDVLVGLDIEPIFTNGAFTGVTNIAARLGGHLAFSAGGDRYIYQQSPATSGSGSNLIIQSASANTSGQGGNIYIYPGSGAGGPGPGKTFIGNQNGWDGIYMTGLVTIGNSGPNAGSALQVNAGGQNGLNIYWDNLTPFMQYGLVSGRQSRFVNSSSYSFSTNLIIGATVNAGYMLDVNGIGRMQTSSAGIPNILHISNLQTDAGPGGAIAFYTGNVVGNASRIVAQRSGSVGQSDIAFETNGVRRLFVSANDGNVGIGTTSPFGKFDVRDGDIFATISSNANLRSRLTYQGLYVSRAVDGAYPENIISQSSAWLYNSRNAHSFFRDTILLLSIGALQGTAGININTNGNVLINTSTDAGFKLDVNGTGRFTGNVSMSSGTSLTVGSIQLFDDTSGSRVIQALSNQGILLRAGTNTISLANSAGSGNTMFSTTGNYTFRPNSSSAGGLIISAVSSIPTSNTLTFSRQRNDGVKLGIINTEDFAVSGATPVNLFIYAGKETVLNNQGNLILAHDSTTDRGNVLIGTSTSTGFRLEVNGNTKVTGTITATVPTANTYVCNIGLAADQSIASGSDAQIDFVDIDDINNWYNPTTKRFTPTIAGYYHVDFTVWFDPATVTTAQYNVQIRKNASTVLIIQQPTINNGTGQSLTGSKLIYFNGTTDYIDFTAYQSTGVNRTLQTGASSSGTYASIFLLAI
jgi:hypothetical protein